MAALFVFGQRRRKQRTFKDRISSLDHLSDVEVVDRYRLSRIAIIYLEDSLRNDLSPPTNRSQSVSSVTKVLVGLRVLSKGNFLSEVADLHGISKQTASRVLHEFVDAVNRNIDNIRFPRTQQELAEAKLGFYKRCKIANIVGAVDGTLVPIIAPKDSGEAYICRKGFHAINVMATCSHDRRFIDIVAKWPGSQHDSSVMNTSSLKEHMESERPGMLLADSGYPLTTSLLTPLANPVTPAEARYNNAQSKGRMVIEQSFGILKGRFRCLHKTGGVLSYSPEKSCAIFMACARLHNMCLDWGLTLDDAQVVDPGQDAMEAWMGQPGLQVQELRRRVVNTFE
ncbi:HARB1-like protein [Mya arenaria]|uniref:Putative nuclease HARBI1 n=1 Tax=Mya arenaria TaxID=6604 RepID=A0ABY7E7U9_MYAAR|nr:putative nuclease HARBI1 [Mya arenaria]WAR04489.1 HARB1-like protein [Mya arenaria]